MRDGVFVGKMTRDAMSEAAKLAFFAQQEAPAVNVVVEPLQIVMDAVLTNKEKRNEDEAE